MNTRQLLATTIRRRRWLFRGLTFRKVLNLATAAAEFILRRERLISRPAMVKIDISPVCNLRCTVCIHAAPDGSDLLSRQEFDHDARMTVGRFSQIIESIKDTATAVSLYTWGDPMTHPELDQMSRIASDAGLQVHISTNLSFKLSDERIQQIVESGLTHLTACVDGLSQSEYEKTRVGGRIDWVLDNLRRICAVRNQLGRTDPAVEVQFIKFQHNVHELDQARELCESYGVDEFTDFWGALHNYADREPENYEITGAKPTRSVPGCYWPTFSTVIKYNGDVIPCCEHRMASQHAKGADARSFGNIFESSIEEIWNGPDYAASRRLVSHPEKRETEPELQKNFCDGCFVIFDTTLHERSKWAHETPWEEVFSTEKSQPGRPVRRPTSETGLAFGPTDPDQ